MHTAQLLKCKQTRFSSHGDKRMQALDVITKAEMSSVLGTLNLHQGVLWRNSPLHSLLDVAKVLVVKIKFTILLCDVFRKITKYTSFTY